MYLTFSRDRAAQSRSMMATPPAESSNPPGASVVLLRLGAGPVSSPSCTGC